MHPLDNVIWKALTTCQAHLGTVRHDAAKFLADVSSLGALAEPSAEAYASLLSILNSGDRVGLFLPTDSPPSTPWKVIVSVPLLQMISENAKVHERSREAAPFVRLGEADVPAMLELTRLTKPGPFGKRTREMGEYWGIRQNGELIAMAGERLHLPGYTEVSAVCTHPEHLGHGYATALIHMLLQRIRSRGEQPFLHVLPQNTRAVQLYERLGFRRRVLLQYVILEKQTTEEHRGKTNQLAR
jgi:ribosomal protein S18 acetylase RimI-like enzyme